jgi:hypothetical protein
MERGRQRHVLADTPRRERTTSSGTRVRMFLYAHPALEQVVALRGLLRDHRQILGQ